MYVLTGTPTLKEVSDSTAEALWKDCESSGQLLPEEEINGARVNRICLPRHKTWRRWFTFNQKVLEYCRKPEYQPEVVQFVTNLRPRTIPWLLRLRLMRVPTSYAVTLAPDFSKYSRLKVLKFRILFNLLSSIVTNSSAIRDMLEVIGVTTPVEVIPNGVNLKRFRPARDDLEKNKIRKELGIPENARVLLAVGAVSPRKGSDLLVEAWARVVAEHSNVHLLFVGPRKDLDHPGLKQFHNKIETAIEQSGSPQQVHFAGLRDNVEDYLRASDILLLPSEREGMPNSMLEAMATGLPVIITRFIGLTADLGIENEQYLLADRSVDGLRKTLCSLIENPKQAAQLATRGYDWVVEKMDVEHSLDRYADMYRRIAMKGDPGS